MNYFIENKITEFFRNNEDLICLRKPFNNALDLINKAYSNKGMLLICGNGGSAADSEHIVGELMKGFLSYRPLNHHDSQQMVNQLGVDDASRLIPYLQGALPAISLVSQSSLLTAYSNDVDPEMVFAQQVYGYKGSNNLLIGISTSGNSKNIVNAMLVAKAFGMDTIGFTGEKESSISALATVTLKAPSEITYKIQEYHLKLYHLLCICIESEQFSLNGPIT